MSEFPNFGGSFNNAYPSNNKNPLFGSNSFMTKNEGEQQFESQSQSQNLFTSAPLFTDTTSIKTAFSLPPMRMSQTESPSDPLISFLRPDKINTKPMVDNSVDISSDESVDEVIIPYAPISAGGMPDLISQGRSVKFLYNPAYAQGSLWISSREKDTKSSIESLPKLYEEEKKIYTFGVPGIFFSEQYCGFVEDSYKLMCEYTGVTRGVHSNNVMALKAPDSTVQKYTNSFINLIETFIECHPDVLEAGQLADSLNIVKCLNATRFTPDSKPNISEQLMEWVNTVDEGWSTDSTKEIMLLESPIDHPAFWDRMVNVVCRGQLDVAAISLEAVVDGKLHEDLKVHLLYSIQLCRTYPVQSNSSDFRAWKGQCNDVYKSLQDVVDDTLHTQGLSRMLDVMRGNKDALIALEEPWFIVLADMIKFHDPVRSRLKEYYDAIIATHPIDVTTTWEKACSEVFKGNYLTIIRDIESLDRCTAVTVTELCRQRRLLDIYTVDINQSEKPLLWLTLSHAQNCLENARLIKIGVEILENISDRIPEAQRTIEEFLPRYDFKDSKDLDWAVEICRRLNLNETILALHRISAMKYIQEQCFLEALIEFDRAKDFDAMRKFSWALFEDCLLNVTVRGDPLTLEAVSDGSSSDIPYSVRECLAPFAVLVEYLNFLKENKFSEAAKSIVALVEFPYIPSQYYGLLVVSVLPMLSRSRSRVFNTSDLVALISALDKLGNNVLDSTVSKVEGSGKSLIEYSLSLACSQMEPWDWRQLFQRADSSDSIIQRVRIDIAREISRSYLDGE